MDSMFSTLREQRLSSFEGLQLTDQTYNLAIGVTLLAGILLDIAIAYFFTDFIVQIHPIVILIVYLIGSFGCTFVIYHSSKPLVSFLGFMGLAAAMGILLTNLITVYSIGSVLKAFNLTGVVFLAMVALSTLFPQFFLSIGRGLGAALLITLVVEVFAALIFRSALTIADYLVVLIFAGYVGYDWARAQRFPKTLDNAIDSAADIYVDIVNLFIRILRIIGKSKKD